MHCYFSQGISSRYYLDIKLFKSIEVFLRICCSGLNQLRVSLDVSNLDASEHHDSTKALTLLDDLGKDTILLADRAHDTDDVRCFADQRGAWPNIPPRRNRKGSFAFSSWVYRQRNLVERFFNKLKNYRGIATRYDRKADTFLAAIKIVAIRLCLKSYESTP